MGFLNKKHEWALVFVLFSPFIYTFWFPGEDSFLILRYIDSIKDNLKIISFLVICGLFIYKKKRPSTLLLVLFLMEFWIVITTYINNPEAIFECLIYSIAALSIAMLVEMYSDDVLTLLKGMMLNFEIALYLNIITVFMFNEGAGFEGRHYLLGYYNTMIVFAYPAIAIAVYYMVKTKRYVRSSVLIAISVLTIIMAKGSTPLGALIASLGVLILLELLRKKNINNACTVSYILAILFNIFILFFYSSNKIKILDFFITKVLNRSTSFTGRTPIWSEAIKRIMAKPVTGYGFDTMMKTDYFNVAHAHNRELTVLLFAGLIGFILYLVLNIIVIRKVDRTENSLLKNIFISLIFGVFLTHVTEAYAKYFFFYIIFFLAYHMEKEIRVKK